MTRLASAAELLLMKIIMTVGTLRINRTVMTVLVTTFTGYKLMATRQFKLADRVVKYWNFPVLKGRVALVTASIFKLFTVHIRMAEITFILRIIL